MRGRVRAALLLLAAAGASACEDGAREPAWETLFDGGTLQAWSVTRFGGEGEVELEDGRLILHQGSPLTGVTWSGARLPTADYELALTGARLEGTDFFVGLTFPVGDRHGTLVLGGWGGALVGLSCLDGRDASENETTRYRGFEPGQVVDVRVRVAPGDDRLRVWLDGEPVIDVDVAERAVSLRPEVELSRPLGVASFATKAAIGPIRLRRIDGEGP